MTNMRQHAKLHTVPAYIINLFFAIGLLSAVAFRTLIVFTHTYEELFRPVWYMGTIGYILFFLYRYAISQKRKRAIERYGLISKLKQQAPFSREEREVVIYLLSSLRKSREHLNYLFIFALSFAAIVADVFLSYYC
ncbi:MAG: hypothetical protein KAR13_22700 [Desulfobulbaceae bacterium]|nr:hypothetical protein [Desulfobulbaceae bacterium]MCK5437858.1 hypothetical protein [Desulfobulbaceae bacterium]